MTARRRPDESMTLLVEVMEKPLDPGYAEAAARRAAGEAPRRRWTGVLLLGLLAVLLGLVTMSAAVELRAPQAEVAQARAVLEDQIVERRETAESLRDRSAELSAQIEELQHEALSQQDPALLETLRLDGVTVGSTAVTGPGLVVTLADGDGSDDLAAEEGGESGARVRDADLQTVVNALWSAGAEAIAVDDQRLTAMSAIRNAGDAVLVDLVPLTGPTYVIHAVGDPDAMQAAYARTGAPAYLQLLGSRYGISSSVVPQSELALPGVGSPSLRSARPVDDGGSASAAVEDVEGSKDESQEDMP